MASWDEDLCDNCENERGSMKHETTIDGRFAMRIVKTSNNEILPDDEPLFLMRARDHLAIPTLKAYREKAVADGCNDWFLGLIDERIEIFEAFAREHPERMKQPGITKGR